MNPHLLRPGVWLWHIASLFTLAVAHPVYSLMTREGHATFFIAHQAQAIDVWLFVCCVSLAVPVGIFVVLWAINGLSRKLATGLYYAVIGIMMAALRIHSSDSVRNPQ
jgi:hypothetical protein